MVLLAFLTALLGCEKEDEPTSLFPHRSHIAKEVPISCTVCHAVTADVVGFPTMDCCLICHLATKDDPWFGKCSECHEVDANFVAFEGRIYHRVALHLPLPSGYADVFFDHKPVLSSAGVIAACKTEFESPFAHRPHREMEMTCETCHEPQGPAFSYPKNAICLTCHAMDKSDAMAKVCGQCHTVDREFGALANPIRHRESLGVGKPPSFGGVRLDHQKMAGDENSCLRCHGGDVKARPYVEVHLPSMAESMAYARSTGKSTDCLACHTKSEALVNARCLSCHRVKQDDVGPALMRASTKAADALGLEAKCSLCHRELDKRTQPPSHKRGDWHRAHGFDEDLIDRGRCAICHDDDTCRMCHAVEQPRSHTNVWRTRVHGLQAVYERDRCLICHRADSCDQCHRGVSPRSHRVGWGAPRNRHCLRCHVEPGEPASCYACHRENRVRAVHQAESQASFSDPTIARVHLTGASCLLCHETLVPSHGLLTEDLCTECHRF